MRFTDILALPCPSPEDYGALALYMQRLAFEIEAKILSQRSLADDFDDRRVTIWQSASLEGPGADNSDLGIQLVTADVLYSNVNPPFPVFNDAFQIGINPGTFLEPGIYHIGFIVNMVETGAVTNDSFRHFSIFLEKDVGSGTVLFAQAERIVQAENIAGGSFFGSETTFEVDQDFQSWRARMIWRHGNTGSTVQIPIGGLYVWLYRIGSGDVIEVV